MMRTSIAGLFLLGALAAPWVARGESQAVDGSWTQPRDVETGSPMPCICPGDQPDAEPCACFLPPLDAQAPDAGNLDTDGQGPVPPAASPDASPSADHVGLKEVDAQGCGCVCLERGPPSAWIATLVLIAAASLARRRWG